MKGLYLILLLSVCVGAKEKEPEEIFEYTGQVKAELEAIVNLSPEVYFQEIDKYRSVIEKYIEHKKRVCEGDFSTMVLDDKKGGASAEHKESKKLSAEEKKLCFKELKALQITFINHMFLARKKYLDYLHSIRIMELTNSKKKIIKSLQDRFSR